MGIFRGSTPQILQDLGVAGIEYQITLTLTPEQIRSLNTLPVDIVVPANANTFLAPGQVVFVGSQGSVAYSSAPGFSLQYSDASHAIPIDSGSWDGTAGEADCTPDALISMSFANPEDITSLLGLSLQVIGGNDVTDGDASCTIILTYMSYDLSGLL